MQTAKDFHPEVLKLFDQYVHGGLSRRGFLSSAGKYAAGAMTAEGLLMALSPNFAQAQQIKPDDNRLVTSYVEYPSPNGYGTLRAYLVKPANADHMYYAAIYSKHCVLTDYGKQYWELINKQLLR